MAVDTPQAPHPGHPGQGTMTPDAAVRTLRDTRRTLLKLVDNINVALATIAPAVDGVTGKGGGRQ